MRERYFSAGWEWECCGGPLRIGDDADLRVQYDSEYVRTKSSEFASVLPEPLTGVEVHHDDDTVLRRGRVVALDAVIADTKWVETPRERPEPPLRVIGRGVAVGVGGTALGQAAGEFVEGTSRVVPISVVPDADARPEGAAPDLTVYGEQVRPALAGYVITIEVP